MTRERDVYLTLPERSKIANQQQGDLFVSIHADASPKRHMTGMSTYVFDNAKDEYSKRLAARENASIIRGEKDSPDFLSMMFKSMTKNYFTNQSVELASAVQKSMVGGMRQRYKKIRDLGVRQARFYVLWNTEMPSILVETSFISNREEERRLRSAYYQQQLASSIAQGVIQFMQGREGSRVSERLTLHQKIKGSKVAWIPCSPNRRPVFNNKPTIDVQIRLMCGCLALHQFGTLL